MLDSCLVMNLISFDIKLISRFIDNHSNYVDESSVTRYFTANASYQWFISINKSCMYYNTGARRFSSFQDDN